MSEPKAEAHATEAQVKPILNGRVEITSVADKAELFAQRYGIEVKLLNAFADDLIRSVMWDFVKASTRGIEQCTQILRDPSHFEKVKERRKRAIQRNKEYQENQEIERLVNSSDPVGRLRRLFRERKMWSDCMKRIDTDIAVIRKEWGDVVPPEIWNEMED